MSLCQGLVLLCSHLTFHPNTHKILKIRERGGEILYPVELGLFKDWGFSLVILSLMNFVIFCTGERMLVTWCWAEWSEEGP